MAEDADDRFDQLEHEIFEKMMERNPQMATRFGIHEYDDILPEMTKDKYLENIELMEDWHERLKEIEPSELSEENRLARKLGLHIVSMFLFRLKELENWKKSPSVPQTIGSSIYPLIRRDFAPLTERLDSIRGRIKEIPRVIEEEKGKLEDPVDIWVDMAIESAEQMPMLFKLVLMTSKEAGLEEEKIVDLKQAVDEADEALDDYIEWLKKKKREANHEFAIGPEKFEKMLLKRELGYSADEILELGERLTQESKELMQRYAEEIDPGADVKKVIEDVESQAPEDFAEALSWYEEGLEDAKEFVIEEDLATLPENEEIEVTETPEYLRNIIPFAAYIPPAKFDEVKQGIYLVTPPQEEEKLQDYSYWDVRNTTVHEGYPGHHLQLTAAMTNDDVFRLFSHAVETTEGWAHYCEEMMKDEGFDDTPEARLLQAKDMLFRAVRIIVDVKLSTGQMSFDEAIDYMVEELDMARHKAEAEVKRYTQNPTYQLSYLLGKHMIKELKEDVKDRMGNDFTEKFFHDTILYAGSVPMKYLKEIFDKKMEKK